VLALSLAATAFSGSAQAACTSSVSGGQTRVVCSGMTTNHYWATENTPSSVDVQADTVMQTSETAIRVEGNSTVTIANGATITVTGGNGDQAFNAVYAEDNGSTITNNGTVSPPRTRWTVSKPRAAGTPSSTREPSRPRGGHRKR
jgi:hypothetical protein